MKYVAIAAFVLALAGCVASIPSQSIVKPELAGVGSGTGVFVGSGLILTAGHVADLGDGLTVKMSGKDVPARVVFTDDQADVAVLQIDVPTDSVPLSCSLPPVGTEVTEIGYMLGLELTTTTHGKIASGILPSDKTEKAAEVIVDASGGQGMSGGPAIDNSGHVVGIVVAGFGAPVSPFTLIVPGNQICQTMRDHGLVVRAGVVSVK